MTMYIQRTTTLCGVFLLKVLMLHFNLQVYFSICEFSIQVDYSLIGISWKKKYGGKSNWPTIAIEELQTLNLRLFALSWELDCFFSVLLARVT